jgi:5-methylcytosine-specific restriction endonuclease McrA
MLELHCAVCGIAFVKTARGGWQPKYCSVGCRAEGQRSYSREREKCRVANGDYRLAVQPCFVCGTPLPDSRRGGGRRYCLSCRAASQQATNRRKNAKRRGARLGRTFTLHEIAQRDGWRCHICRKSVRKDLPGTDRGGPTIDHLLPVAAGGRDEPENVALAHRGCNIQRGTRGPAQLRLTA